MDQEEGSLSDIRPAITERKIADGPMVEESPKSASILVVDDERSISDSLSDYLDTLGYRAVPVYNGRDALARLEQNHFDLIITDLKMPGMSGMELFEEIRDRNTEIKVILMTGYASKESKADAIAKGAFDYISKPFHFDQIEAVVRGALKKQPAL